MRGNVFPLTSKIVSSLSFGRPRISRLATALLASLFVVCGAASTKARVCQDTPAERQEIDVLPGTSVRVMFFQRGAKASYIEICKIYGQEMKLMFAAAAGPGGWRHAITFPAESGGFYVKNYSAQISGPVRRRWIGMRRIATPFGYTFNWFDEAGKFNPNTVVEFCLYTGLAKCPRHFPIHHAKNLAQMSEYGRERWLLRWARKHGHEKRAPN